MIYYLIAVLLVLFSVISSIKLDKTGDKKYLLGSILPLSLSFGFFILAMQIGDDWYQIPLFTVLMGTVFYFLFKDFWERVKVSVETTEKLKIVCPALKEFDKKVKKK